jgi:hypothetical protein
MQSGTQAGKQAQENTRQSEERTGPAMHSAVPKILTCALLEKLKPPPMLAVAQLTVATAPKAGIMDPNQVLVMLPDSMSVDVPVMTICK